MTEANAERIPTNWRQLCMAIPISRSTLVREILMPGLFTLEEDPEDPDKMLISEDEITSLRNIAKERGVISSPRKIHP